MDERIIEMEIRIAHQDRVIGALDEVVRAFATRVERLEQQVQELRGGAGAPLGPADDPPPHY
jgi:uncharacterized coiled-coil protein SlyX